MKLRNRLHGHALFSLFLALLLLLQLFTPLLAKAADPFFRVFYQPTTSSPLKKLGDYEFLNDACDKINRDKRGGIYTLEVLKDRVIKRLGATLGGDDPNLNGKKYVYLVSPE